jgi:hypothetical protein
MDNFSCVFGEEIMNNRVIEIQLVDGVYKYKIIKNTEDPVCGFRRFGNIEPSTEESQVD